MRAWASIDRWLVAILAICCVCACSLAEASVQTFESFDGAKGLRLLGDGEAEVTIDAATTLLGSYDWDGDQLRVQVEVRGTTVVATYERTTAGLDRQRGDRLFGERLLDEKGLTAANAPPALLARMSSDETHRDIAYERLRELAPEALKPLDATLRTLRDGESAWLRPRAAYLLARTGDDSPETNGSLVSALVGEHGGSGLAAMARSLSSRQKTASAEQLIDALTDGDGGRVMGAVAILHHALSSSKAGKAPLLPTSLAGAVDEQSASVFTRFARLRGNRTTPWNTGLAAVTSRLGSAERLSMRLELSSRALLGGLKETNLLIVATSEADEPEGRMVGELGSVVHQ